MEKAILFMSSSLLKSLEEQQTTMTHFKFSGCKWFSLFFHFYKGSLEDRLFSVRMYGKRSWAINLIMISWWGLPSGKDWMLHWHMLASRLLIYEGIEIVDIYIYIYRKKINQWLFYFQ